jgi:hypothetical protein
MTHIHIHATRTIRSAHVTPSLQELRDHSCGIGACCKVEWRVAIHVSGVWACPMIQKVSSDMSLSSLLVPQSRGGTRPDNTGITLDSSKVQRRALLLVSSVDIDPVTNQFQH